MPNLMSLALIVAEFTAFIQTAMAKLPSSAQLVYPILSIFKRSKGMETNVAIKNTFSAHMRCEADAETPATLKKLKYASRRLNNNNNMRRTRTDRHTKLASLELRVIWTDNRPISPRPLSPVLGQTPSPVPTPVGER